MLRGRWFRRPGIRLPLELTGGSGLRRRGARRASPLLLAVLIAAAAGGYVLVAWMTRPAPTMLAAAAPAPASLTPAAPKPDLGRLAAAPGSAIVVDGDTLRLQNDVVRLDGVVAPARGDRCSRGSQTDCATEAAAQLAVLVHDHAISCQVVGHDRLGRPSARCDVGLPNAPADAGAHGNSLNQLIVASGWARADATDLEPAELAARASHRGLWSGDGAH